MVIGLLSWMLVSYNSVAQDTLPQFTVTTRGTNKVFISWTNKFSTLRQISIQRSFDSTRNYKTILTVPDPTVLQNGFVDSKAPTPFMFYRLFILLENGQYIFSSSRRPFWDTLMVAKKPATTNGHNSNGNRRVIISDNIAVAEVELLKEKLKDAKKAEEKTYIIRKGDSILTEFLEKDLKGFRDSIVSKTKDTLLFASIDTILIKPFVPKEVYRPSLYVYTERDGNVAISLPDATRKNYSIRFYEEDNTSLFEIKQVKESMLILDKANFLHAGWFRFELYEEGKLKEKHRFFIPKDF